MRQTRESYLRKERDCYLPFTHGYLKNLALAICGGMDRHYTALWDGGHIKFWSKGTITKLLSEQGFQLDEFTGCGRLPYFWKSMIIRSKILPKDEQIQS